MRTRNIEKCVAQKLQLLEAVGLQVFEGRQSQFLLYSKENENVVHKSKAQLMNEKRHAFDFRQ